ncbi:hypothetical protein I4U23_024831 [Adineta vaga]|nr:hypothetical protein I4U23_024831 [Adineta vaga]
MATSISDISENTNTQNSIDLQRIQNILLIWLDKSMNINKEDCQNVLTQLRDVVFNVETFIDDDKCVKFIQTITNHRTCIIVSDSSGQRIVPIVHNMFQVECIFIFCDYQVYSEEWTRKWPKIKGISRKITTICKTLKQIVQECEQSAIPISFIAPNTNPSQINSSFMYIQILKEILLTIQFKGEHMAEFIDYCKRVFAGNKEVLKNVEDLKRNYQKKMPITWYKNDSFLYSMLNRALGLMDGDMIIRMGFFIADLHQYIEKRHREEPSPKFSSQTYTIFRGQGLSKANFEQLVKAKRGLISFNNFLFMTRIYQISFRSAEIAAKSPDFVGVIFVIRIDSTQSITPFTSVSDPNSSQSQNEFIFSMQAMFRIENIESMDKNNRLYKIILLLIPKNDEHLCLLTQCIQQVSSSEAENWNRLCIVLKNMGQYKKAKEIYEILLDQTIHESEKAHIYYHLGLINYREGNYSEAMELYRKSLDIHEKTFPLNHRNLALCYNNMGLVHYDKGEYQKALSYYEKALTTQQESLALDHPDLAISYNNIGTVYSSINDYKQALSYYNKALAISLKPLPFNLLV